MSEKIRDIIFQFKELTDKHNISDDTGYSDHWIYNFLLKFRAYAIEQKMIRKSKISDFIKQQTPCLKLKKSKIAECSCKNDDCYILETVENIPQYIISKPVVSNYNYNKNYVYVDLDKLKYKQQSRYKSISENTYWSTRVDKFGNQKVVILTKKPLESIVMNGVWYNPLEVYLLKDCNGNSNEACLSAYDFDWKLDPDLTKLTMDLAINILLKSKSPVTDVIANAVDDNVNNKNEIR